MHLLHIHIKLALHICIAKITRRLWRQPRCNPCDLPLHIQRKMHLIHSALSHWSSCKILTFTTNSASGCRKNVSRTYYQKLLRLSPLQTARQPSIWRDCGGNNWKPLTGKNCGSHTAAVGIQHCRLFCLIVNGGLALELLVNLNFCISPYPSGLLHWHWGNHTVAPVQVKQPWRISVKSTSTKPKPNTPKHELP